MSELRMSYPASTIVDKPRIGPADVTLLKSAVFRHGLIAVDAVATLLAIEHGRAEKCTEWDAFFVRVLSDHVINGLQPAGHLTAEKAAWLKRVITRGGVIASCNEFEVLIRVIEMGGQEAVHLAAFALDQIRLAVMDGEGPLRSGPAGLWARMTMDHLSAINRILAALSAGEPLSISEAESLFDPAHALVPGGEDAGWRQLIGWPEAEAS